jgi:hypothetical protein
VGRFHWGVHKSGTYDLNVANPLIKTVTQLPYYNK